MSVVQCAEKRPGGELTIMPSQIGLLNLTETTSNAGEFGVAALGAAGFACAFAETTRAKPAARRSMAVAADCRRNGTRPVIVQTWPFREANLLSLWLLARGNPVPGGRRPAFRVSILRRPLDLIDDQHLCRHLLRLQLEPELFLNRLEQRWRRGCIVGRRSRLDPHPRKL